MPLPAERRQIGRKRGGSYPFRYTFVEWPTAATDPNTLKDRSPMVPVALSWNGKSLRTKMLLDTGATTTFIMPWMARRLGLTLGDKDQLAKGAGGSITVRPSEVEMQLLKTGRFGPAPPVVRCHVLVPAKEDALPFAVLGRKPFFQRFEIILRERDGEFVFRSIH
jgi:hypothetical protein